MGTGADAPTPSALAQTLRAQLLAPIASVFLAKQATALDCETESMREILHALVRCALDTIADEVLEAPASERRERVAWPPPLADSVNTAPPSLIHTVTSATTRA